MNWLSCRCCLWCVMLSGLSVSGTGLLFAGDPASDEDEPAVRHPGILGTYSAGDRSVSRRDADIEFVWGEQSPAQELPAGPFQVVWQGKLLVRSPGKFHFHSQLQGQLEATLAGRQVLAGQTPAADPAQWITGPEMEFEYGEHPFVVKFQSVGPSSRVKLYWSSEAFALEPIPTGAYFLNEAHPELDLEAKGKELFAAHRCNRCHQRDNDPLSPAAPDLTHVASGLQGDWIERWLAGDRQGSGHAWMPEFGFTKDESAAIAAYLRHQTQEVKLFRQELFEAKQTTDAEKGRLTLMTLGCLACHTYDKVGTDGPFGGGDLTRIGTKRSEAWLWEWLTDPKKLNADHHMPAFDWNGKSPERKNLAAFLTRSGTKDKPDNAKPGQAVATPELINQGRKLVEAARCNACHRLGEDSKPARTEISKLDGPPFNEEKSCLQEKPNRQNWRPAYPQADVAALRAHLKSRTGKLDPEGSVEQGQRLLAWNNCLQCHPRNGVGGLGTHTAAVTRAIPELEGQAPTLVPPRLNAVGDKLLDAHLKKAVAGEFKSRMPWLRVQMPKFSHGATERQTLTQYFIDHDRIESPPKELVAIVATPVGRDHTDALEAGKTLVGSQGFSCVACHQFGNFVPRNTALGTRGSDLLMIGQRMRREFFFRLTRSPIRIVPDIEMPGYERPVTGVLGGRIENQLAGLWTALNDASSARSLDVSSLQQNLVVRPGEPARIIRDVFYMPKIDSQHNASYVPRTLAVGFHNQHNVLFDLERFEIKNWWQGDFARQRTEGKSWSWEQASDSVDAWPVRQSHTSGLAWVVRSGSKSEVINFDTQSGTLVDYARVGQGVRITYLRNVPDGTRFKGSIQITEVWEPIVAEGAGAWNGWSRAVTISGTVANPQCVPVFVRRIEETPLESLVDLPKPTAWKPHSVPTGLPIVDSQYADMQLDGPDRFTGTLHYTAKSNVPHRPAIVPDYGDSIRDEFATVPGFSATRLPLPRSIMPTAMTWTKQGTLAFTSLKGQVYLARDTNGDGLEDKLDLFEEGLAAPYGIISDPQDDSLIVSHKPELLRLIDTDGDGRVDLRKVLATGWGYNDNYHDWTCGIVRDSKGNLYVGLGSDYTQPKRPVEQQKWRGKILRIDSSGYSKPIASGLRYPTGLAMTPDDDLFVSDNQGEQNVFNELNHIVEGSKYGVPSREDPADERPAATPAIQIPHPWTRSVNGVFFLPRDARLGDQGTPHPFAGHGIGCEYDSRFLVRFTLQKVGDTFQGAIYSFSQNQVPADQPNFEPILCGGVSPRGDIYVGCMHDSGWSGGLNVGSLIRITSNGPIPLGIRELRATKSGFQIDFTGPVDRQAAVLAASYSISAYTRKWQGTYATADSNRHEVAITGVTVSEDGLQVQLQADKARAGYVYEVTCGKIGTVSETPLWPATGHYTMNRVPE